MAVSARLGMIAGYSRGSSGGVDLAQVGVFIRIHTSIQATQAFTALAMISGGLLLPIVTFQADRKKAKDYNREQEVGSRKSGPESQELTPRSR